MEMLGGRKVYDFVPYLSNDLAFATRPKYN